MCTSINSAASPLRFFVFFLGCTDNSRSCIFINFFLSDCKKKPHTQTFFFSQSFNQLTGEKFLHTIPSAVYREDRYTPTTHTHSPYLPTPQTFLPYHSLTYIEQAFQKLVSRSKRSGNLYI